MTGHQLLIAVAMRSWPRSHSGGDAVPAAAAQAPPVDRRRGVALVAALAVMMFIALLVTGAFAVIERAQRSSQFSNDEAIATATAGYALHALARDSTAAAVAAQPLGRAVTYAVALPTPLRGMTASVAATRLPHDVLWLVADVTQPARGVHRRVNLVARWRLPLPVPPSPLMARGRVRLRAGLVFAPVPATDPSCAAARVADITVSDMALVTNDAGARVAASARAADSASYLPGEAARRALNGRTEVVRVEGDTTIAGGRFDGILLVDGEVSITGSFRATGLIMARGAIHVTGDLVLTGAMATAAPPDSARVALDPGRGTVRFDPCLVARLLRRASLPAPVVQRSWTQVF